MTTILEEMKPFLKKIKSHINRVFGTHSFVGHGSLLFLMRIAALGLGFLFNLVLARVMPLKDFTEFIYVWNWLNILLLICVFGFDTAALRFIPPVLVSKDWGLIKGLRRMSLWAILIISLLSGIIGSCLVMRAMPNADDSLKLTFLLAFTLVPFVSLLSVQSAWLHAYGKVVLSQFINPVLRPLIIIAVVSSMAQAGLAKISAADILVIHFPVIIGLLLFSRARINSNFGSDFHSSSAKYQTNEWLHASFHFFLITSAQMALTRADVALVGMINSTTQAGIYAIATQLAGLILLGNMTSTALIAPKISAYQQENRNNELQSLLDQASWINLGLSVPIVVVLVLAGNQILGLFGTDFTAGYFSLALLAAAQLLLSLTGAVGTVLSLTGHQVKVSRIIGINAILNIILNVALIPTLGILGAAIATAISNCLRSIQLAIIMKRELGLSALPMGLRRYFVTRS